ncbi:hypothetical protein SY83_17855 [Paenibacillus swuensis]|uniref:Prepilin type IV endopeptidase peptidase domain-containing protein n=2 Tax=Paenibacillus swuensis TaxID=1178515 RepID=A0A172TPU4_9BACL|nr:hypothetical protein SY83_17855 [Paenibacillus swuensis]
MLIALITDTTRMIIPNTLTVGGAAAGLLYHTTISGWEGFLFSFAGLASGFGLLVLLYAFGGIGAGDVKLFGAIGAITGTLFVIECLMYSIIYGAFIGILLFIIKKQLLYRISKIYYQMISLMWADKVKIRWRNGSENQYMQFPFMYAVFPAGLTSLYYAFM